MVDDEMNPTWLTLLSGGKEKSRFRDALILGGAAVSSYRQAEDWITKLRNRGMYIVTVKDTDPLYDELHVWLLDRLPPGKRRSLRAFTHRTRDEYDDFDTEPSEITHVVGLVYDGTRSQKVDVDGHTIEIAVDEPDYPQQSRDGKQLGKPGQLTMRCPSVSARDAVLKLLRHLATGIDERQKDTNRVYISSSWGSWNHLGDTVPRPLESVVLQGNIRDDLVADMRTFNSQESDYRRLGIPWHRGYLLYGPPGTGKTSIAQAVAGELGIDVYYIPLSDLQADTDLANMLSRITPRSMLLLEDIDVAHAARERDDKEKGISLSGLLNALDGIITPHGLITVMTTNDLDALDPALVRPGRADRTIHIDYADTDQLTRLLHVLLGIDVCLPTIVPADRVTPAEIVEVIKPFIGEPPVEAARAVQDYLELRLNAQEADPVGPASVVH